MGLFESLRRLLLGPPDGETESQRSARKGQKVARRAERFAQRPRREHPTGEAREDRLRALSLPAIASRGDLARAMGISERELVWLADPYRLAARRRPHYRPVVRTKRDGRVRVLLAPKKHLKAAQHWILRNLLDRVPPAEHAHGFVRGRSIRTNAEPHVGREILVQLDLRDFFHQFTLRHARALFRSFGYSGEVARTLAFLTTAPVRPGLGLLAKEAGLSRDALANALKPDRRWRGLRPFLPQGAPTSPAMANLLCRRLDARLAGLAARFRARYTRYADDITFSGGPEFRRDLRRFLPLVREILREHRLPLNHAKLRFARKSSRQLVTGLVVNRKVNVPVREIRLLRAILHNAGRTGLAAQNRAGCEDFRAHLAGRIAFVESVNAVQGERLKRALAAVGE